MSNTAALSTYRRVIVSKRDGTCHTCGATTRSNVDFAAVDAVGKWFAFCTACAGSYAAQVAGLIKRSDTLSDTAPEEVLAGITLPDEALLVAVMNGTAGPHEGYEAVLKLTALNEALAKRPIVADPRVEKLRLIAADANAQPRDRSFAASLVSQYDSKGDLSPKQWACAERMASPVAVSNASGPVAAVEVGIYLATDGTIYKGYLTQNDRIGVRVLHVTQVGTKADGTPEYKGTFEYLKGGTRVLGSLLARSEARLLTQAEAAAFGKQYAFCCACARDLSDDRSIAAGYGETCSNNNGWWYPTKAEAAEILNRPTEVPDENL